MDNGRPLRVGIIGMGRSGRILHAAKLRKMSSQYVVAAVADSLEERRDRSVEDYGCNAYASYQEMLENESLDIVVNAAPSDLHFPITFDLLARGVHVVCEKPLAKTADEADRLIAAAEASGKTLAVFHQFRYLPAYEKLRDIVASGVLGRIVQLNFTDDSFTRRWDWQTLQRFNGGNLLNAGSHLLDQALQFLPADAEPRILCAMDRANTFGDAEDYVKILLRGDGCPTIDIEISSCAAYADKEFVVQGTNGGLRGTSAWLEWKYYKPEEAPEQRLIVEPIVDKNGDPGWCSEQLTWYDQRWEMSLPSHYEHVYEYMTERFYVSLHRSLTDGTPIDITPRQVRREMAVMEQCRRQNPHIYA